MTHLNWYFTDDSHRYYRLNTVDLAHSHFDHRVGVYIIFYVRDTYIYTVYTGQGIIRERFQAHRRDARIQSYAHRTLNATWADTTAIDRDGIEKYLHNRLNPFVSDRTPTAEPIEVNLPWA